MLGLKMLVLTGAIPHITIGVKRLIDLNVLDEFLLGVETPHAQKKPEEDDYGTIRRLPEKPGR